MANKDDNQKKPEPIELSSACEAPGILFALCVDAESQTLYGGGTDHCVYRVDLSAKKPVAAKAWTSHSNYVSALVWLDGTVISAGFDRQLIWTSAESGETTRIIENAHGGWIRDVVAFPDGSRVATAGDDMLVKIRDAQSGQLIRTLDGHAVKTPQGFATALYSVAVSPDGQTIAGADRIGDICLWDVDSGRLIRRLKAPDFYTYDSLKRSRSIGGIRRVRFSPDGNQLAVAGIGAVTNVDGFVGPARFELWDWKEGIRVLKAEDKHKAVLNDLVFHPALPLVLAAGGGDSGGFLGVWQCNTGRLVHKIKPKGHIQQLWIDAEAQRLYAVGHGGSQTWKLNESFGSEIS